MTQLKQNHPFHLVDYSPWPILSSFSCLIFMNSMIQWFYNLNLFFVIISTLLLIYSMFKWWSNIIYESTYQGNHTKMVMKGMKLGMILFIVSEILFFFAFFWSFFHSSLSPNIEIGNIWPPKNIISFNPFNIPLLNSIILLSSGFTITWAHHNLLENNLSQFTYSTLITILLGIYFTILQAYEYMNSSFSINSSIYGSTFFMSTGFHGLHVLIGTTFILVCLIRHLNNNYSFTHHLGFEMASWYWHFVDVVWLFLYINVYWWMN